MKYSELYNYIEENGLLKGVQNKPGIYGITVDNQIVYVGQSNEVRRRCGQHIYNTHNAIYSDDNKYRLLLASYLGGHEIDCQAIIYCDEEELASQETYFIKQLKPCLNKQQNDYNDIKVNDMKIDNLLEYVNKKKQEVKDSLGI